MSLDGRLSGVCHGGDRCSHPRHRVCPSVLCDRWQPLVGICCLLIMPAAARPTCMAPSEASSRKPAATPAMLEPNCFTWSRNSVDPPSQPSQSVSDCHITALAATATVDR